MELQQVITNNIGAVSTVLIFIWYLVKKDKTQEEIFEKLANKLEALGHVISSLEGRLASIEKTRVTTLEEKESH